MKRKVLKQVTAFILTATIVVGQPGIFAETNKVYAENAGINADDANIIRNDETGIPWILFHTVDGDIIIGREKRGLSIEWQKNYESFDINKLFSEEYEYIQKWEKDGKRGISVWEKDKAFECLKRVQRTVNHSKS